MMFLKEVPQTSHFPQRIVSLVPSQTELLYSLGLEEKVAGITKFCIHPQHWRKTKTIVGGTKQIHTGRIDQLLPDLIIANKEENVKEQVEQLAKKYPVWVTDVNNLSDALLMIRQTGELTGTESRANELAGSVEIAFSNSTDISSTVRTCYLIWQKPYMTVGGDTFINDMMIRAGLINVFANRNRYPEITLDEIRQSGCELLLLSSEPFPFGTKHIEHFREQLPGIKVLLADGEMFSWYGSRLLQTPDYMKQLHKLL